MEHNTNMQNFVQKFNLSDLSNKQIWLSALFIFSSFAFWVPIYFALNLQIYFVYLIIAGLIWLTFAGLSVLFLNHKALVLSYGVLTLLFLAFFGFHGFVALGIILFLLGSWLAHRRAERMSNNMREFRAFFITKRFFPVFLTSLALLLAFMWQGFLFSDLEEAPQITPRVFHALFVPTEAILEGFIPGYETGMSLGEFQQILQGTSGIFGTEQISGEQQPELLSLTLEEFTLLWINDSIEATVTPYLGLAPVFIIIALFLVLRFLLWYLKWAALLLIVLAVKIMLWYNILVIKEEKMVVQTPILE